MIGVFSYIGVYLLLVNILGLLFMGIDKHKAKKRTFRIPEATLFTIAIIGGSIGTLIGMYTFRHKTRHWYFTFGIPGILIIQMIIVWVLIFLAPIEFRII